VVDGAVPARAERGLKDEVVLRMEESTKTIKTRVVVGTSSQNRSRGCWQPQRPQRRHEDLVKI